MYQNNNQETDKTAFKTYMVRLPMEDFKKMRDEIRSTLMWDKTKWWRCLHGMQPINTAERIVITQILQHDCWATTNQTTKP